MSTAGDTLESLPDDVEGLPALVLTLMEERVSAISERDALQAQNDRIRHLLLKLRRMQFGPKSERLPEEQLQLGLEALEQAIARCEAEAEKRDPELQKAGVAKTAPIATEAIKRIGALYEVEARVRGKSEAERLAARQAESRPLVLELRTWFEQQLTKLPARGTTAVAIRYALNHWDGLERFLADGRIELDTNSIERSMRPVALSRKNSLFAGSDEGASYCSSGYVLIRQENFEADFQISVGVTAWPRRRGERRPAAGRHAGLSRVLRCTTAEPAAL